MAIEKKYRLARPNTQLHDPVSGWGISGPEVKPVPEPVPERVQQWIKHGALVEVKEGEGNTGTANPVDGLNVEKATHRIEELNAEELALVLELDGRKTVQQAAAKRIEELKAGGGNEQGNAGGSEGTGVQPGNVPDASGAGGDGNPPTV